ncbi:hypothetical protein ILUMI_08934 [Ignelater luminosus]|uniref:Uncharacterized protein n=1 Tax=Ignelater luminosus TaxID=2038154 RepID=A0A8K0GFJ0_IGNLU|nr:hypothetical protein ILUMI_08934 [Ignelater luminosus]
MSKQCLERLSTGFPDSSPSRSTIFGWYAEFKRGRKSLKDEEPSTVVTDQKRNPHRKTNIGMFSEETMGRAVGAALNGRSIRSVAKQTGLSFQTLARYKSAKVLAAKGAKQVNKVTSSERRLLVTTCVIVNAARNHLPPAMIFSRVHSNEHVIAGAPSGTLGLATPSGWMSPKLFFKVMEHFIKHPCSSNKNSTLLLYDNHESH